MRTILLVALLLPGVTLAEGASVAEQTAGLIEVGDGLVHSGTPGDLKAAILLYEEVMELEREGTSAHRQAAEKVAAAKQQLRVLAAPARDRASAFVVSHELIEAERWLCEAIAIDPYDRELRSRLGAVRHGLRREALEYQRRALEIHGIYLKGLGVPPEFEFMTNDPRFASPGRPHHRG